jgi:hypothetical protein
VLKLYTSLVELSKKNDIHVFSSMYQRVGWLIILPLLIEVS